MPAQICTCLPGRAVPYAPPKVFAPFDRAGTGIARNSSPNMALYWSFLLPSFVCLAFTCFNQCFPKTRFQPVPPRSGGKEKAAAARRAADCYGYITTTPIPLTNENPRDKLPTVNLETPCPTVLPGTDTGPASHGMCSGANRRVVTSGAYKIEVRGLIMAVWLEKTATNRSFSGLSTSKN